MQNYRDYMREARVRYLRELIREYPNVSQAARAAGMNRTGLYKLLARCEIEHGRREYRRCAGPLTEFLTRPRP